MNYADNPSYLCCGAHMTVAEHNEWCLAEIERLTRKRRTYPLGEQPARENLAIARLMRGMKFAPTQIPLSRGSVESVLETPEQES